MKPNLYYIEGGVGKHLQFTALLSFLYRKYNQKLIINSEYPELFNYCPEVADSKKGTDDVFFDTYQQYYNHFNKLFFHDPYKTDFVKGKSHVVKNWADLYKIKINDYRPNFSINPDLEKKFIPHIKKIDKFILLQFTGGQGIESNNYDFNNLGKNYKYGQELISLLTEFFPRHLLIVFSHFNERREFVGETKFNDEGGLPLFKTREDFMVLSKYCDFFISIDSALQHMGSNQSFNKKGIVLWGTSKPERFGYKENINIISEYPYCVEINPKKIIEESRKLNEK